MEKTYNNDVICMMPWIHMHIWPNGNTMPCCMSDSSDVFGNTNHNTIDEIINNDKFKKLRLQMISGVKPDTCSRCYELEQTADSYTLRKNSLQQFKDCLPLIDLTEDDGSVNNFRMRYMDIRFSNLCNMKCRTCGPDLSSKWHDDQIKLFPDYQSPKFIDVSSKESFMDELTEHLDYVDEVYFAGGEALITPQHYDILDYWLSKNNTNVRLRYTTNFSALKYKNHDILEYWNKFDNVRVAASLDTHLSQAEYSRSGTKWDTIVCNRKKMLDVCPDVYFEITPTVSMFNIMQLFDFHRSWVEQELLEIDNIRFNILTAPRYFSITMLSNDYKNRVKDIYSEYIRWLKTIGARPDVIHNVSGIVDHMMSADNLHLLPEFKREITTMDNIRQENFLDVYPEFGELWTQ